MSIASRLKALFSTGHTDPAVSSEIGDVPEGTRVGRYVVLERLGEGGMGIVYRARDPELNRYLALKFLPPHLTADRAAVERFRVEAQAAASLDHPHICTIHEIGTHVDGRLFIAMPHYEGETLKHTIERRGRLPPPEAAEIARQALRGLGRAHEAGIVHRDIKPANLFLTSDGTLKILDFGIAKVAGVELTQAGAALGTMAYMSPEQIRGEPVDGRSDLWSLGVVLFETVTGERPFIGAGAAALMRGILDLDPPTLDAMLTGFPPHLSGAVAGCLQKDPSARPRDAAALLEVLSGEGRGPGADSRTGSEDDAPARTGSGAAPMDDGPGTEATGPEPGATPPEPGATPPEPGASRPEPVDTGPGGPVSTPTATVSVEGERRQATILVAEVAGRNVFEEVLSRAKSDALITACRETMAEVVRAHGGVATRNTGETLSAVFGVPATHEDDPQRATHAARELVARIGEMVAEATGRREPGLRCGIDSGRLVARREDSADGEYRIVGGPAELSPRLAAQARVGEVLVSEDCRRLVAPFFELEPAGSLPGGESDEPVGAYRVLEETGVRTRLEAAVVEGLTELSGREAELHTLLHACDEAAEGRGRFVAVVGEAGVGKSRLIYELARRLDDGRFAIVRGRCQSFGAELPYLPFIEALRDRLGVSLHGGRETRESIGERVRELGAELEDFIPFYLHLLSLIDEDQAPQEALGGEQFRVGLVESLSALLTLGAQRKPTVVLLEDWHWVDAASRQVLRQLLEMVAAYPLVLLVTSRPEAELDWVSPAPAGLVSITLGPLEADESTSVIRSVLEADDVPGPLARLLHERTGGNPFFLEEVCQALAEDETLVVERGRVSVRGSLDHLELPDTVQGVLRTRLDRLEEGPRRLLRYASVIGREFGRDVLEAALPEPTAPRGSAAVGEGLDALRDLGLIQQIRVVPAPVYRFKHALTQDVAYDSLLERQKAEIHGAVGHAIESLYHGRLDDRLERLAEHFARAGRWEKAIDYAEASMERLWSFSEFEEASEMGTRGLAWIEHIDDDDDRLARRVRILLRQERLYEFLGERDKQQEIVDELLRIIDPDRDPANYASALIRQGDLFILVRQHAEAERALEEAIDRCRTQGDPVLERHALRSLGLLRWHQDRHAEAIELVDRALALDREQENEEAIVGNLTNLGGLYLALGDYDRAVEPLLEALERERRIEQRQMGLVSKESYILHRLSNVFSARGDNEKALEYLEAARDTIQATRSARFNVVQMHYHLTGLARIHFQEGRVDESLELYMESVRLTRKTRHLEGLSTSLRLLGEVLLALERYEEALPRLEEAAEILGRMRDRVSEAMMWRRVATAREALEDPTGARDAWERTRDLAVSCDRPSLELEACEGLGRALRPDDPAAALRAYQNALRLADGEGSGAKRGALRYQIGVLHWEYGAYDEALGSFESAYADLSAAGDRSNAGLALNSVGRTLRDLGRFDEARSRLEEAVEINAAASERLLESHALATLGDVLLDLGDPVSAGARFTAAAAIREELGDDVGRGWILLSLARAQASRGSADGVAYYLAEAEEIASRHGDAELQRECETSRRSMPAGGEEGRQVGPDPGEA